MEYKKFIFVSEERVKSRAFEEIEFVHPATFADKLDRATSHIVYWKRYYCALGYDLCIGDKLNDRIRDELFF